MRVVVDTSVLVKWFVDESDAVAARSKLKAWSAAHVEIVVPSLAISEAGNVLLKYVLDGRLSLDYADFTLLQLPRFVRIVPVQPSTARNALALAHRANHRSIYDMHYVALAEEAGCELWTADERFWRIAHAGHPQVRWLGDGSSAGVTTSR